MLRGAVSNSIAHELWVHCPVVFEYHEGNIRVRRAARQWLWYMSRIAQIVFVATKRPPVLYIDPHPLAQRFEHFERFEDAKNVSLYHKDVWKFVVNNPNLVGTGVTMWAPARDYRVYRR